MQKYELPSEKPNKIKYIWLFAHLIVSLHQKQNKEQDEKISISNMDDAGGYR